MLKVLITNEKGVVQVEEQVEGYALLTIGQLEKTNDKGRVGYDCMAVVGGEMSVGGYMALDKNVSELQGRTREALQGAMRDCIEEMSPEEMLGLMKDSLEFLGRGKQPDLYKVRMDDLLRDIDRAEQEGMRAYEKSRRAYEEEKDK